MSAALRCALLALALGACGGAQEPPPESPPQVAPTPPEVQGDPAPRGRQPTAAERRIINDLTQKASEIRGLAFKSEVSVEVHGADDIAARLAEEIEEEELLSAKDLYVALGLLPADLDLEAMLIGLMTEQVVGYYHPESADLVVREDVMTGGVAEASRMVLIHELVHALQDQQLRLGELHDQERDTDAENAYRSLVEGDATLAMMAYLARAGGVELPALTRNPDLLRSMMGGAETMPNEQLDAAPAIVRATLLAAYLRGLVFAATLYNEGGWDAVDRAHGRLPASTEQILHPEAYLRDERPRSPSLPALEPLEAAGFRAAKEDTLGELEMAVYFAQGTGQDLDEVAAAGWGGDRLRLYQKPSGEAAVVWLSVWDTEADAREAEAAARRVARGAEPDQRPGHLVRRSGRALLILRGVPGDLTGAVGAALQRALDGAS